MLLEAKAQFSRYFWTMANNHDVMDLTLHGGGQGFDSSRLHLQKAGDEDQD
jgi:hypothetical protein